MRLLSICGNALTGSNYRFYYKRAHLFLSNPLIYLPGSTFSLCCRIYLNQYYGEINPITLESNYIIYTNVFCIINLFSAFLIHFFVNFLGQEILEINALLWNSWHHCMVLIKMVPRCTREEKKQVFIFKLISNFWLLSI